MRGQQDNKNVFESILDDVQVHMVLQSLGHSGVVWLLTGQLYNKAFKVKKESKPVVKMKCSNH